MKLSDDDDCDDHYCRIVDVDHDEDVDDRYCYYLNDAVAVDDDVVGGCVAAVVVVECDGS